MGCCQCDGIEAVFSDHYVQKELRRYRDHGPSRTSRALIDQLLGRDVTGLTLLDVGGGVGAIHHELIQAGLKSAVDVDASTIYLAAARMEAQRRGHAAKVTYHHGDFVDLAEHIAPADIVTLDRVLCCYDDMERLVDLSARRALRYYGLVYPRETPWVRLGLAAGNLWQRLKGSSYRAFLHSTRAVEDILLPLGFCKVVTTRTAVWQTALFARS